MRIADGLAQLKGRYCQIPDCSRDDLPAFFVERGFERGAEIGVFRGAFSKMLCNAGLSVIGVDPYLDYSDFHHAGYTEPGSWQARQDYHYRKAMEYLRRYVENGQYRLIRKKSQEAQEEVPDESLDFVYIDGQHWLPYVVADLWFWGKKVKKGGIISGHDYVYMFSKTRTLNICHVPYAIEAYTQAMGIQSWYVLGRKEYVEGEKRDRWRSWLFVKE